MKGKELTVAERQAGKVVLTQQEKAAVDRCQSIGIEYGSIIGLLFGARNHGDDPLAYLERYLAIKRGVNQYIYDKAYQHEPG